MTKLVSGAIGAAVVGIVAGACSSFAGTGEVVDDAGVEGGVPDAVAVDPIEASADASVEATPAADTGVDAPFAVSCGPLTCRMAGEACCRDRTQTQPNGYICALATACPNAADRVYTCDDTNDCVALGEPQNVCCGTLAVDPGNTYFLSVATCTRPENCVGKTDLRLCDRAVGGECPSDKPCVLVTSFPKSDGTTGSWGLDLPLPACQP